MEGSLEENDKKVEYAFLTDIFEELCPFFISIGMTYKEFWEDDVTIPKSYLKAYKMKIEREQEINEWRMWKQGVYVYEALCDVSPILHAFSKKGTKPLPYPTKPYGVEERQEKKSKEQMEQEAKNERLRAQIRFNNWARATKKHFEKEAGGQLNGNNNR